MNDKSHVLISLEERHANNILAGTKQVELRRRTMNVEPGSTVWFYVKKPVGAVVGYAVVGTTFSAAPSTIWRKFGAVAGLSKAEFMGYFNGLSTASAMGLDKPRKLTKPISLEELRTAAPSFQPPQFFCRLSMSSPVGALLVD